jgi:hypothetical protein
MIGSAREEAAWPVQVGRAAVSAMLPMAVTSLAVKANAALR